MIEQSSPQTTYRTRPILLAVNIFLGILLWLALCSDYSWDNAWANTIFPPIVGLVGLVSLFQGREIMTVQQKRTYSVSCLPAIIGGIPYLILIILAIVPPFLLATMFWFDEQSNATLTQRVESPNGVQIAEVYFLPVGAYSGGNGRLEVHLKYKWLPFVKRDVFYMRVSHADETTHNNVAWIDDKTLYIREANYNLGIKWIEWEVPSIIAVPIGIVRLFLE